MIDKTEATRRDMIETDEPQKDLAEAIGLSEQTWTTEEMVRDFEVLGFMAPFVVVRRRSDGVKGSLEFTASPRVYLSWKADS
jgi:hypothetical protein